MDLVLGPSEGFLIKNEKLEKVADKAESLATGIFCIPDRFQQDWLRLFFKHGYSFVKMTSESSKSDKNYLECPKAKINTTPY